jgi:hypothetical protein
VQAHRPVAQQPESSNGSNGSSGEWKQRSAMAGAGGNGSGSRQQAAGIKQQA